VARAKSRLRSCLIRRPSSVSWSGIIPDDSCVDSYVISSGSMRHDSICPFGCEAGMTVQITRRDHDAASLREHASRACEASVVRRLLALALVLEGHGRVGAAKTCGMDRQTLRDWVHRYNERGIDGLSDRPHGGGAPPKLTVEEKTQLAAWVRQGPNVAEDGVVRWRLRDLRDRILARFFVPMDERSVGRILKTLTFSHISVRPRHPQADAAAQEAHKKTSPTWSQPRFPLPHRVSRSSCGGRTKRGLASKAA
jgi:transposase